MTDVTDNVRYGLGARPPWWPLIISGCALLTSAFLLIRPVGESELFVIHALGWMAGAWIPVICLVLYRLRIRALGRRPDFTTRRFSNGPVAVAAAAGWVLGLGHGYYLAMWWVSG